MELVTGRKGSPHVTSQQDRMLNQGIFGDGSYILATGQQLEPQVQTSNEIRIRDGAIMAQGALGCVKVNTYDSVTIQNGNQGMKRIDLICWQYTYDAEQDVESASWVVVQGTPAETDPEVPAHTEGNIQEGDTLVQIPVFAVNIDGINVTGVDVLLNVAMDMSTANAYLSDLNEKFITESVTTQVSNIPAGGTNYNVNANWQLPSGYKINSVSIYATAGCIAGNSSIPDDGFVAASVYNPTSATRSPYVTWRINLEKE